MKKPIEYGPGDPKKEELSRCVNKEGKGKLLLIELIKHSSPYVDGQDWSDHADHWARDDDGSL